MARFDSICARRIQHNETPHHRNVANRRKEAEQPSGREGKHGTGCDPRDKIPPSKGGRHRPNATEKEIGAQGISGCIQARKTKGGKYIRKFGTEVLQAKQQGRIY